MERELISLLFSRCGKHLFLRSQLGFLRNALGGVRILHVVFAVSRQCALKCSVSLHFKNKTLTCSSNLKMRQILDIYVTRLRSLLHNNISMVNNNFISNNKTEAPWKQTGKPVVAGGFELGTSCLSSHVPNRSPYLHVLCLFSPATSITLTMLTLSFVQLQSITGTRVNLFNNYRFFVSKRPITRIYDRYYRANFLEIRAARIENYSKFNLLSWH